MNKINVKRNHEFPQAALVPVANQKVEFMYRDSIEFAKYGIKAESFAEVKLLAKELSEMLPNINMEQALFDSQKRLNALRKGLVQLLDQAAITVEFVYSKNSAEYKTFKFASAYDKNHNDRVFAQAVSVCKLISEDTRFMNLEFPKNTLTNISTAAIEFAELMIEVGLLKNQRKYNTVTRIEKANVLYAKLTKLCSVGKRIWLSQSKVHYDDYVLKKTPKPKAVTNSFAA